MGDLGGGAVTAVGGELLRGAGIVFCFYEHESSFIYLCKHRTHVTNQQQKSRVGGRKKNQRRSMDSERIESARNFLLLLITILR